MMGLRWVTAGVGLALVLLCSSTAWGQAGPTAPSFSPNMPTESAPSAARPSLDALLKLYFQWRGGPAFDRLQSYHVIGHSERGVPITRESWADRSGRSRDEENFGGPTMVSVVTPSQSWTRNPSGQIDDDPASSMKAKRDALAQFGDALHGRGDATLTFLGYQSVKIRFSGDNRDALCGYVRVTFGDADIYDYCLEANTGALIAYTVKKNGRATTWLPSDWRFVDGVRMPFYVRQIKNGGYNDVIFSSISINEPLNEDLFNKPAHNTRTIFDQDIKSAQWIKFDLVDNRIEFPILINGRSVLAILDSGAYESVIDQRFVGDLGLTSVASIAMNGVGPSVTASSFVQGVNIRVGTLSLSNLTLLSADFSTLTDPPKGPVRIILGGEVFNELAVDIDFAGGRIAFRDPAHLEAPMGAAELPLTRDGSVRLVPLSIEGRPPIQVALDLGDNGTVGLFPDYARSIDLLKGRSTYQNIYGGFGGPQLETVVQLTRVTFAGASLADVPASVFAQRQLETYSERVQGVLGAGLLKRFRLIIDFSHARLYVAQNASMIAAPDISDGIGKTAPR